MKPQPVLYLLLTLLSGSIGRQASGVGLDKMYWSDRGSNTIRRANLDGTGGETLISGLGEARGLAVDYQNYRLYWVDNGTNKIQRSRLDGSHIEDLVTERLEFPAGIALNVAANKMYWADTNTNRIQWANLDGTQVEDLVTELKDPYFLTLDLMHGHLYWTDYGSDKIQRSDLDGQHVVDLVTTGLELPRGIDLDLTHGKIYWADRETDLVQRANLDGSQIETLHQATPAIAAPHGVALDVARDQMYWVDNGLVTIKRARLDGSGVEEILNVNSGALVRPWQIVLDLRTTFLDCNVAHPCTPAEGVERATAAIDQISSQLGGPALDARLDFDADGQLTASDRDFLLQFVLNTQPGDATLDGRFSTDDLVQVFTRGEYADGSVANSGWGEGDWSGDGEFDSTDLVLGFQAGYDGAQAAAQPVPEPSWLPLILGWGWLATRLRTRAASAARKTACPKRATRGGNSAFLLCLLLILPGRLIHAAEADWPAAALQQTAEATITASSLRAHIRFLADDLLEGRGPGSKGDELAQRYTIAQFESLGLQPAAADGWRQTVPLVGVTTRAPDALTLQGSGGTLQLKRHDDYILSAGKPTTAIHVADAEFVFVGYGIVAPEYQWDDYKGVDLRGKILVFMNNDPANDPQLFAGPARLYYGRWDYKYEMAAQQGAAGAIIIHTTESAGYPYQVVQTSWTGEEFELRDQTGPRLEVRGWMTEAAANRVAQLAGRELDELRRAAESPDFKPIPLGVRTSVSLSCQVRDRNTANVLGLLPGSDPTLSREAVVYMAHHDHLGLAESRDENGDNIYNGAVDNATGMAALLTLARAYASLPQRPSRSILFAAVGAEEQGLLGSKYFAAHPTIPPGYLAAVLNIDGANIWGRSRDVNVIGLGKSNLDRLVQRVAAWQNRVVTPDQFPDRGYYYRSDQFSLAKIGVPGVYLHSGIHILDRPEEWGRQQQDDWVKTHYHQPSDEYQESWDLGGAVQDAQLLFHTGWLVSQQPELPEWAARDEFLAPRLEALKQRE